MNIVQQWQSQAIARKKGRLQLYLQCKGTTNEAEFISHKAMSSFLFFFWYSALLISLSRLLKHYQDPPFVLSFYFLQFPLRRKNVLNESPPFIMFNYIILPLCCYSYYIQIIFHLISTRFALSFRHNSTWRGSSVFWRTLGGGIWWRPVEGAPFLQRN